VVANLRLTVVALSLGLTLILRLRDGAVNVTVRIHDGISISI
jgi:hypothetical protein